MFDRILPYDGISRYAGLNILWPHRRSGFKSYSFCQYKLLIRETVFVRGIFSTQSLDPILRQDDSIRAMLLMIHFRYYFFLFSVFSDVCDSLG